MNGLSAILPTMLLVGAAHAEIVGSIDNGRIQAAVCAACHDGASATNAMQPHLAGQMPEYLAKQLHDFQAGQREGCAHFRKGPPPLSDQAIADLAAYFASQPAPLPAGRTSNAAGEKLFTKGRRQPGFMPACIGCHGLAGAGKNDWNKVFKVAPAILPSSIAGQPSVYLVTQLKAFREGSRTNDQGRAMRHVAAQLSDEDIKAVADYAAALRR